MNYLGFIALVSALVATGAMSMDMYIPSFPGMAGDLAATAGDVQLTMSVFLFGFAASQLVYGPLSDRYGRRRVLIWGMAFYFLASIACTYATTVEMLIGFRLIQAFGACSGTVIGRAMVRDRFELKDSARAFSYLGMTMMLAPILSPILGAWLEIAFGWRSNFVFMAAFGATILLVSIFLLTETNTSPDVDALRLRRMANNYATLLRSRRFMGYALSLSFAFAGVFSFVTGSPFVMIELLSITPDVFAIWFAFVAGGYMVGSFTSTRLVPRLGIDRTIALGTTIYISCALILIWVAMIGHFDAWAICAPMIVISFGNGMVIPNCQAGSLSPFPKMAGAAAALMGCFSMIGAGLGGAAVAAFYDGTQFPMVLATLFSAAALFLCFWVLVWPGRETAPD
jgi:MFS transporter, DHA1 family, multidrug resistance protein